MPPALLTEPLWRFWSNPDPSNASSGERISSREWQSSPQGSSLHRIRLMKLLMSLLLAGSLLLGTVSLIIGLWAPQLAESQGTALLVLQVILVLFIAAAMVLRKLLGAARQRINDRRDRQLQALLSMCRVVKHELNNDMQVVMGNAELASMMLEDDSKVGKPVQSIREAATLAIDRIQQLSVYSTSGGLTPSSVDLNALLRETANRLHSELSPAIRFRMELDSLPSRVLVDRNLLCLSLSYLVRLAARSLSDGAEVVVRTCKLGDSADSGEITISAEISVISDSVLNTAGSPRLRRENEQREQFARILRQAQQTTTALVECSGASILEGSASIAGESLLKMGFVSSRRQQHQRDVVVDDDEIGSHSMESHTLR